MGSTIEDYKFLYGFISLVKPDTVIDIGTNYGVSAIAMAMALRDANLTNSKILSIDVNSTLIEIAKCQIEEMGLSKYVETLHGTSSDIDENLFFDVAFIDGDHTFEGCERDFLNIESRVSYMIFHDVIHIEEVQQFINFLIKSGKHDVVIIKPKRTGESWSRGEIIYKSAPGIAIVRKKND